jgi:hypothetical protein
MFAAALTIWLAALPTREAITATHRACIQHDAAACLEAASAYPAYLSVHGDDWDMRFFFAELLWEQERFAEAANEYHLVARMASARYAKLAAYDEILALQRAARDVPHRFDGQPWPLSVEQQRLIDAIDFHLAQWPQDQADDLNLSAYGVLMSADDFDAAERRLDALTDQSRMASVREDLALRRTGAPEPLGRVEPIGEPQTIGAPQTIGQPQDLGVEPEPFEPEFRDPEYDDGPDVSEETASPPELILE